MTLVVGYSPTRGDRSPLDLGATLARSIGTDLLVVAVVPAPWPTPVAGGDRPGVRRVVACRGPNVPSMTRRRSWTTVTTPYPTRVVAVPGRSVAAHARGAGEAG